MREASTDIRVPVYEFYEAGRDRLGYAGLSPIREARVSALWRFLVLGLGGDLPLYLGDPTADDCDPGIMEVIRSGWTKDELELAIDDLAEAGLITVQPVRGPRPYVVVRVVQATSAVLTAA